MDSLELQQVAPEWWRMQVSQEPSFLNATILENLKIANPQADDAAVNAAINAVGLQRYISETKDGFEAIVEKTARTWLSKFAATGALDAGY